MTTTAMQLDLFTNAPVRGERSVVVIERDKPAPRRMAMRSAMIHEEHEQEFRGRKRLILDCLRIRNRPMTDRQILNDLFPGRDDPNLVRPRISDLIREGALIEAAEQVDEKTGETVRTVWLGR
jgi:hypothetical protein